MLQSVVRIFFPLQFFFKWKKKPNQVLLPHLYIMRILFKIMANCTDLYGIYCNNLSATNLL